MSWEIELKPTAYKQYQQLNKTIQMRIRRGLHILENDTNPLHNKHVKPLAGQLQGDYRLRIGNWRMIFTPD